MASLASLRRIFVFTSIFYAVYLFTYKCPQVVDHPIEQSARSLFSPLASTHKHLCGHLNHGHQLVSPYLAKVHGFLDDNVHSTAFFKENKIEEKIQCAKGKFDTHVYPIVEKVWEGVEIAEAQLFDFGYKAYGNLEQHFHKTVVPKAGELKDSVVPQAEKFKDAVVDQAGVAKDAVVDQAEAVKEEIHSRID